VLDLLGLDEATQGAYRLWLRDETLGVEAVGAALGQPVGVIAAARDRLIALSLLVPDASRPGQLMAVHPEAPLEQLIQDRHEQLIRAHEHLLRAHAQVSALVTEFLAARPTPAGGDGDLVRATTADGLRAELAAMITGAHREILSVRTRATLGTLAAELLPLEMAALGRGAALRTVVARPRAGLAWVLPRLEHLADVVAAGAEIRLADDPEIDLTVVDRRVAVVRLADAAGGSGGWGGGLVIRAPDLAGLVIALFDHLWEAADPLGRVEERAGPGDDDPMDGWLPARPAVAEDGGRANGGAAGPPSPEPPDDCGDGQVIRLVGATDPPPSAAELLLLELLADGLKDEAVARALGVSVRTVRRMVAELMNRLDARSRFQAAILAKQRGWL
jgi:DNA-binding CsgD family transcriptional regulator